MKNSINPKLLFYGALLLGILLAMALDSCRRAPAIIVEVPAEAWGPDTLRFMIRGRKNDHTLILENMNTGGTMLMGVSNPYSQAYETGQVITLIK